MKVMICNYVYIKAGLELNEIQMVSAAQRLVGHFKKSKSVTTALLNCWQQMSSESGHDGNSTS